MLHDPGYGHKGGKGSKGKGAKRGDRIDLRSVWQKETRATTSDPYTTVGNGQLVVDFSSPRNGKVVVFVLNKNASAVSEPQFEVRQISGPFGVAMVRIGTLQVLVVTDESMKRITDFLPG